MKQARKQNIRHKINSNINRLNLHKFKYLRGLVHRTIIALSLILTILVLKKINLRPTNSFLDLVDYNVRTEYNLIGEARAIYKKAEKWVLNSDKVLNVFNPIELEKYPSPMEGVIYRGYSKGTNEGVDIKSSEEGDPKSIIEGRIGNIEQVDKKGYFVTIEKENLEIIYGYLSKPYVAIGDKIEKGDTLGSLGTNKDGSKYLRLEVKVDGKLVNPVSYIDIR